MKDEPCERLLADFELLEEVGQRDSHRVITDTAPDEIYVLVRTLHDLLPPFVNVAEALRLLGQLLGDIPSNKHGFEVTAKSNGKM
jgi:hypothetical protein